MVSSGRDHAPFVFRNRADEVERAGHHGDTVTIIHLAPFQLASFQYSIEMRRDGADYFDGPDAVADRHHFISVNPLLTRPDAPLPLHGAGGIDENSIEIEKYG